ncbi:MAG: helix-turn-helix domain-containing protein [Rhodocyclaceae bacterium]
MNTLRRNEYFEGNNPISILPRMPQPDFPEHSHDFDELVMVRSGCGLHYINGQPWHIGRGSVFYLRAGQAHAFEQSADLNLTNVVFAPELLQTAQMLTYLPNTPELDTLPLNVSTAAIEYCERLFALISAENASDALGADVMVEAYFSQLVILLWREHRRQLDRADGDSRLAALIRHLDKHMAEDIDFEALAERFHIPLRTLHRRMLDITGLAPAGYLGRVRLCSAMRMLARGEQSVTDIAFACGFNDSNYFSSRFHREFGCSPQQYRRQIRTGRS